MPPKRPKLSPRHASNRRKSWPSSPDYGPAICVLGLIDAALGKKELALEEGRRAMELMPEEKDALNGQKMRMYFCIIAAWVGEKDVALQMLAADGSKPGWAFMANYGDLKLHPFWDPQEVLRDAASGAFRYWSRRCGIRSPAVSPFPSPGRPERAPPRRRRDCGVSPPACPEMGTRAHAAPPDLYARANQAVLLPRLAYALARGGRAIVSLRHRLLGKARESGARRLSRNLASSAPPNES